MTRANTPVSASFRRFLPFSPWLAPASLQGNIARQHRREYADSAHLRLKKQKPLEYPSLAGAKQFCRAEMCPDKERPAGNTCRISKGLDAVWAYFCPSKPRLPLSTDGIVVDLIVHKRGYDEQRGFNNLFCIEMKKAYKRCDLSSDKERLRILTDNFCGFGYKAGFMITATADKIHDEYKLVVESAFYNHSEN